MARVKLAESAKNRLRVTRRVPRKFKGARRAAATEFLNRSVATTRQFYTVDKKGFKRRKRKKRISVVQRAKAFKDKRKKKYKKQIKGFTGFKAVLDMKRVRVWDGEVVGTIFEFLVDKVLRSFKKLEKQARKQKLKFRTEYHGWILSEDGRTRAAEIRRIQKSGFDKPDVIRRGLGTNPEEVEEDLEMLLRRIGATFTDQIIYTAIFFITFKPRRRVDSRK